MTPDEPTHVALDKAAVRAIRNQVIEECAKACDDVNDVDGNAYDCACAVRALKK